MKPILTFTLLCSASTVCLASPLSDWFALPKEKRGDIPTTELQTKLDTPEAIRKATASVWEDYKQAAIQQGWHKAHPAEPGDIQTWIKDGKLDYKVADIGDKKMPYIILAKGKKPATGWPLFFCLHGGGANPNARGPHTWQINTQEWQTQMHLATNLWDAPGLYVIPRMADDRDGRWYYGYNQIFIDRLIQQSILFNNVDPDRVFLMGISEGGYTAFRLGSMMADRWAGSCAMAAAEPLDTSPPENLRHVAFRCGIGEKDTMFNRHILARNYFKRLAELNQQNPGQYIHHHDEQKGRGHGINYKPGPAWIAKHTRTAVPKVITWTIIKQHDRHRNRLYWLALDNYTGILPLKLTAEAQANNTINITAKTANRIAHNLDLRVYLNNTLADLGKPVTININGKQAFQGTIKPSMEAIIRSTAERGDPKQVFPVHIPLKWSPSYNQ